MKISKFKIPKDLAATKGLKEIDLTEKPLGSIVALAGINGSGKSRILEFVRHYYNNCTQEDLILENHFAGSNEKIPQIVAYQNYERSIKQKQEELNKLSLSPNNFSMGQRQTLNMGLVSDTNQRTQIQQNLPQFVGQLRQHIQTHIKYVNPDDLKKLKSGLPNNQTFKNLLGNANVPNEFDFFSSQSTIDYIIELCTDITQKRIKL